MKTFIIKSNLPIFPIDAKSVKGDYEVKVQAEEVSDGYHTMSELYKHRMALFAALCNLIVSQEQDVLCAWKSKRHSDGEIPFNNPEYFVAGISMDWKFKKKVTGEVIMFPIGPQITYHMKIDPWWDRFKVPELEKAPEYDGHTSQDVIERLLKI